MLLAELVLWYIIKKKNSLFWESFSSDKKGIFPFSVLVFLNLFLFQVPRDIICSSPKSLPLAESLKEAAVPVCPGACMCSCFNIYEVLWARARAWASWFILFLFSKAVKVCFDLKMLYSHDVVIYNKYIFDIFSHLWRRASKTLEISSVMKAIKVLLLCS